MQTATNYLTAGNWRNFESFAWFERPDNAADFAIVYTHNRDSDTIARSNGEQIAEALAPFADDVIPQNHSHWACGWVAGFAIRVYRNGELTPAAQVYNELQARIEDYPLLNEEHHSALELEEQTEALAGWAGDDFERQLEKRFEEHAIELNGEQRAKLFDELRERSNTDWISESSGVYIDIGRIVSAATIDDIADFVPVYGLKVFRDGEFHATGSYHCGTFAPDTLLDGELFEAIEQANDNGEESTQYNGALFTWRIE